MMFNGALLLSFLVHTAAVHPLSRRVQIRNEGDDSVVIDWINPKTGESVRFSESQQGQVQTFDSYVNHTFAFRSSKDDRSSNTSTVQYVTVGHEIDEQVIVVKQNLEVERVDPAAHVISDVKSLAMNCRNLADRQLSTGQNVETATSALIKCMEKEATLLFEVRNEELAFQRQLRKQIASLGENYTCADPYKETSIPKEVTTWIFEDDEPRTVGILHQRPDSQIHILHDFISDKECEAIKKAAAPLLHRGTVADGKGGSKMSESRKAWQAGITVKNWESTTDPIANVKRRLFAYANHAAGYNMTLPGQEDVMSIQYFGNGTADPTPDRYSPHCDGDCDGLPHKTGGRVATMVMYCDVPEVGGATNFQHANVYVKPQKGAAAFFSYMDPITMKHEEGFTTHSGCPVIEGTKRIAVQWMRIGVDEANPWDSFDTNTISVKNKE